MVRADFVDDNTWHENNRSIANLDFVDFAEAANATADKILRELTS